MKAILLLTLTTSVLMAEATAYTQDDRERMIRMEVKVDEIDKRFEQIDRRFEQVDKRFEQVDKRFEQLQAQISQTNQIMLGLMAGIFAMIGFMWWDRRTILLQAREEMRSEVREAVSGKADREKLEKVFDILAELAKNDPSIRSAMEKHHLKLA